MSGKKLILLDETVDYFDYGDFVRAVIYRTDPETGVRKPVDEFALTNHCIQTSLFGPNGKVWAAQRLAKRLGAPPQNVVKMAEVK